MRIFDEQTYVIMRDPIVAEQLHTAKFFVADGRLLRIALNDVMTSSLRLVGTDAIYKATLVATVEEKKTVYLSKPKQEGQGVEVPRGEERARTYPVALDIQSIIKGEPHEEATRTESPGVGTLMEMTGQKPEETVSDHTTVIPVTDGDGKAHFFKVSEDGAQPAAPIQAQTVKETKKIEAKTASSSSATLTPILADRITMTIEEHLTGEKRFRASLDGAAGYGVTAKEALEGAIKAYNIPTEKLLAQLSKTQRKQAEKILNE